MFQSNKTVSTTREQYIGQYLNQFHSSVNEEEFDMDADYEALITPSTPDILLGKKLRIDVKNNEVAFVIPLYTYVENARDCVVPLNNLRKC